MGNASNPADGSTPEALHPAPSVVIRLRPTANTAFFSAASIGDWLNLLVKAAYHTASGEQQGGFSAC